MSAAIKLVRVGKRGKPSYRIVVMDRRKKRNGEYLEQVGFYNPLTEPATLNVDEKKLEYWLERGAVLSEGLQKLKIHRFLKKD